MLQSRYFELFAGPVQSRLQAEAKSPPAPTNDMDAILFNFGDPFPASFPYEELADSFVQASRTEPERTLQYGAGSIAASLGEFVADRARRQGVSVTPNQTFVSTGSSDAIDLVCRLLLNQGDTIMTEAPTFLGALGIFRNFGVTCKGLPVDSDGLVTDSLERVLKTLVETSKPTPKFVYVIPTFQNPTGVTMSVQRRHHLLELAYKYNFLVLEDDPYGELRFEADRVPTLFELDRHGSVIYLGTFSKLVAPGTRLGWMFAPREVVDPLRKLNPGFVNGMAQSAVAHYCSNIDFEARVDWLREVYATRRDAMLAALERHMPPVVTWNRPEGGLFFWLELPQELDSREISVRAREHGVAVLSGHLFYPEQDDTRHLRLAYSLPAVEDIDRGIATLAQVISDALS